MSSHQVKRLAKRRYKHPSKLLCDTDSFSPFSSVEAAGYARSTPAAIRKRRERYRKMKREQAKAPAPVRVHTLGDSASNI